MYLRIKILFIVTLSFSKLSISQIFNCEVQVIAPTLQNNPANEEIFSSLKNAMIEYINFGYNWTNDKFEQHEQIDVSFLLTLNSKSGNDFSGKLQITSQRPVFNSDYKSLLMSYIDKNVTFKYIRNSPIQYFEGQHVDNLADILAYYIYMILGYDYDSFSMEGGTPYFNKADQILSICQSASEPGWKAPDGDGSNNRFWLIQNALQPQFTSLRKTFYNYHISGLDQCYINRDTCIKEITSSVNDLLEIHKSRPSSLNMQLFFNAKYEELIKIYLPTSPSERNKIYNLVSQLDPSRIKAYNKLK
jgi:FMN-dependent NADH-azoreductase